MQTNQTNTSLKSETSASMRVFGNIDLTGVIMSFYASNWGLRPPSLVSRGFMGLGPRGSAVLSTCATATAFGGFARDRRCQYLAETLFVSR